MGSPPRPLQWYYNFDNYFNFWHPWLTNPWLSEKKRFYRWRIVHCPAWTAYMVQNSSETIILNILSNIQCFEHFEKSVFLNFSNCSTYSCPLLNYKFYNILLFLRNVLTCSKTTWTRECWYNLNFGIDSSERFWYWLLSRSSLWI